MSVKPTQGAGDGLGEVEKNRGTVPTQEPINLLVKTPLHRRSMEVRRSGLWAPDQHNWTATRVQGTWQKFQAFHYSLERPLASGFSWETANCTLQLRVCSFTLPRFPILARRSLFSAAMLFFTMSTCMTFIAPKTGIIHWFEFKNSTYTSQTDIKS